MTDRRADDRRKGERRKSRVLPFAQKDTLMALMPEDVRGKIKAQGLWNVSVSGPLGLDDDALVVVYVCYGHRGAGGKDTVMLKVVPL